MTISWLWHWRPPPLNNNILANSTPLVTYRTPRIRLSWFRPIRGLHFLPANERGALIAINKSTTSVVVAVRIQLLPGEVTLCCCSCYTIYSSGGRLDNNNSQVIFPSFSNTFIQRFVYTRWGSTRHRGIVWGNVPRWMSLAVVMLMMV